MAYNSPLESPQEYGSLENCPDKLRECIEECHDNMTVEQFRQCADYFNKCASGLEQSLRKEITVNDFEEAKKDKEPDYDEGEE